MTDEHARICRRLHGTTHLIKRLHYPTEFFDCVSINKLSRLPRIKTLFIHLRLNLIVEVPPQSLFRAGVKVQNSENGEHPNWQQDPDEARQCWVLQPERDLGVVVVSCASQSAKCITDLIGDAERRDHEWAVNQANG